MRRDQFTLNYDMHLMPISIETKSYYKLCRSRMQHVCECASNSQKILTVKFSLFFTSITSRTDFFLPWEFVIFLRNRR